MVVSRGVVYEGNFPSSIVARRSRVAMRVSREQGCIYPGVNFQILRIPGISRDKWTSWDISSSWSELTTVFVRLETWLRTKLYSS
jgi:hypothetical protein